MRRFAWIWLGVMLLSQGNAVARTPQVFVIGVENHDYLPVYSYDRGEYRGFARELFDTFARDSGRVFQYQALPVPRLYASFFDGRVDFKFPDNAGWQKGQREGRTISYSEPVLAYVDGVVVTPERRTRGLDEFRVLGTVAGFTPWAWLDHVGSGKVSLAENASFESLLRQALAGRIDGAYANVAVVNYLLDKVLLRPGALVFATDLPFSRDYYHLSTLKHPEVVREFNLWMKRNRTMVEAMKARHGVEKGVLPE